MGERKRERERWRVGSMREEREIALCNLICRVKQKLKCEYKTARNGARIKTIRECCDYNILNWPN